MLSEVNPNTIEELLCTEEEVLQTIDISKSSGPDRVSGRMLKAAAVSIAAPVTKLFNLSPSPQEPFLPNGNFLSCTHPQIFRQGQS